MIRKLAILAGLAWAGCSYQGTARDFDPDSLAPDPGWIVLKDVPVLLQRADQDCGAAALAMALTMGGRRITLDEIARDCPPDPERGIRAGSLRDCARHLGFSAFLIHGRTDDIRKELAAGRPLIVGLVKPYASGKLTHFELVVGFHPERGTVLTIDPARGWRSNSLDGFLSEWDPAGRLTLVVLRPHGPAE
jgi:ABC-type bacteriocin/lantibiotic exporter with double-glycine peptidase domain